MSDPQIVTFLESIDISLQSIATSLQALVGAEKSSFTPGETKSLEEFIGFDWSAIGAEVVEADEHGAKKVKYNSKVYTRRNPLNKFGVAIWYSRANGKDGDDVTYETLIGFKTQKIADAEPLNEKTIQALSHAKRNRR